LEAAGPAGQEPEAAYADEAAPTPERSADAATAALLALLGDPATTIVIPERIHGVVVGTLLGIDGGARVAWPGAPGGAAARVLGVVEPRHVGGEVALMFEQGEPTRPMVMAPIETLQPLDGTHDDAGDADGIDAALLDSAGALDAAHGSVQVEAIADGERVVLQADRELVLRCGKASITLTRAGKIIIRGAYVSSHATGTHRIRGGTVEIN